MAADLDVFCRAREHARTQRPALLLVICAGLAVGRRADLLSAARGAHYAGESRVAVRGAGSATRGDQHALAIAEKQ